MRGVTLEEVSAATRISTRFLEAIENDHWDLLPGGVFNRGFIRSVARFLGLDEDSMVAEYALETRGRVDAGVVPDAPMEMPRNWKPAVFAAVALVVVLASAFFAFARYQGRIAARFHKNSATSSTPAVNSNASDTSASVSKGTAREPLELTIKASAPVDVKIVADGSTLFSGHIDAGEAKQFDARDALEITSSEPSAVLLELNGQNVPMIGQPGLPGSVKLTRNDLQNSAGGSH
jgi:cytoskeletal protein RodZ